MLTLPPIPKNFNDQLTQFFGAMGKNVTFIVTHQCNMRCTYCYEHHKENKVMSLTMAKKFVDLLFSEDEKNSPYLNPQKTSGLILEFIGGEPLLEIDLIDQTLDYFLYKALDLNHRWANLFMISISTNGILYLTPKVQNFMKKWNRRLSMSITIDGNKELHDSCRHLVSGEPTYDIVAEAFKDARIRFNQSGTKLTLSKDNLQYLSTACIDMIQKFNLEYLFGNPVFEENWTNQDALLYYNELKKLADWLISTNQWQKTGVAFFTDFVGQPLPETDDRNWCGGAGDMLAFDVDGTIYPCLRYAPLSIGEDLASHTTIGHVDTGLVQQPCEQCFMDELCAITRRSQSTDKCWSCPIATGCATCSAWQYELYGTANRRCTNICPMHQARVMAASYFYNTLYRKNNDSQRFALNIPKEWAIEIISEEEYNFLLDLARGDNNESNND